MVMLCLWARMPIRRHLKMFAAACVGVACAPAVVLFFVAFACVAGPSLYLERRALSKKELETQDEDNQFKGRIYKDLLMQSLSRWIND